MFLEDSDFEDEADAKTNAAKKTYGAKGVPDMKVESFEPELVDELDVEVEDSG